MTQHETKEKDLLKKETRIKFKKYTKKRILIPVSIILFLVFFGLYFFINSLSYQSTDDAFIEGRFVQIAPKVSGQIISLKVDDNDYVQTGDLLLELDFRDYKNKVDELENALKEAQANKDVSSSDVDKSNANLEDANKNLEFAKKDFERYSKLKANGLCTTQQYDLAENSYKQAIEKHNAAYAMLKSTLAKNQAAKANIAKIEAQLAQAKLDLSYTKIYAPQDGYVSARAVEKGNYVNKAQPLMSIVSPNIWVVANFKETQLTKMKKGQPVTIKIDTYPGKKFKGEVDSIQLATGAKSSLFPP